MADAEFEQRRAKIESYSNELSALRRDIHQHPEMAYQPVDEVCPGRRSHRLILWGPGLKGICR